MIDDTALLIQEVDILLLTLLAVTAVLIVRAKGLFAAVMMTGIYSFLSAGWMLVLDAPDVAFTEASVGAGLSTVLMLGTLSLVVREGPLISEPGLSRNNARAGLIVVILTGAALIYGTLDMPLFGDPAAPIHQHVAPYYLERGAAETGSSNIVTAVLASYRGYDTLGETTVIFTAGLGVTLLLGAVGYGVRRSKRP
jgi:multicomponent Na+:H+ antiporter subunit B